jgi:hypothetical protein
VATPVMARRTASLARNIIVGRPLSAAPTATRNAIVTFSDFAGVPQLAYLLRRAGSNGSALHRVTSSAKLLLSNGRAVVKALASHCEVTGRLAGRFGLGPEVDRCLS